MDLANRKKKENLQFILYGAGKRCRILCEVARESEVNIVAVVDSDPLKWGQEIEKYSVKDPQKILDYKDAIICITVADENAQKEIRTSLKAIMQQKYLEVSYNELLLELYKGNKCIKESIMKSVPNARQSILLDSLAGLNLGGVEGWILSIYDELLKQKGKDIYIICDNGLYKIEKKLGEHLVKVNVEHKCCFGFDEVRDVVKKIAEHLPCTVITTMVDEVMLAAYMVKLCYPDKIKIISSIHNSIECVYKQLFDFQECNDLYVAVSQDIIKNMKKIVPSKEVFFMTLPFECPSELSREYRKNEKEPLRIGFAGRVVIMQKRIDLLIKVIDLLEAEAVNYEMEIAGDGADMEFLKKELFQNKYFEKIKLLGEIPRKQMGDFWKRQDIYINVSDHEGNCTAKLEAMGSGVVPIVTNTSGTAETITDGENGFIVDVGDYEAMARKIKYLAEHRELLEPMGKKAHDAVFPKSSMEKHMELWNELLLK